MPSELEPWHGESITAPLRATLAALRAQGVLDSFYLAGGTALALYWGHRRSVDLDFFSSLGVDTEFILQQLHGWAGFQLVSKRTDTLHLSLRGAKVSFLGYRYPMLAPTRNYIGVAIADPLDIACMKLSAIAGRGTKRDFIDLHEGARRLGGMPALMGAFRKKFASVNFSLPHIAKSLAYFDDAGAEPMPDMLIPADWPGIQQYFRAEARRIL